MIININTATLAMPLITTNWDLLLASVSPDFNKAMELDWDDAKNALCADPDFQEDTTNFVSMMQVKHEGIGIFYISALTSL